MPSVFTRIINGELPGRFVWKDDEVVAFLTTSPMKPGHTLVVPRQEVDGWVDLEPALAARVMDTAQCVARGIQKAFQPPKVGLAVVGLEVRHVHLHLVPIWEVSDMDFARQDKNPTPADLDDAAARIRTALLELGYGDKVATS